MDRSFEGIAGEVEERVGIGDRWGDLGDWGNRWSTLNMQNTESKGKVYAHWMDCENI